MKESTAIAYTVAKSILYSIDPAPRTAPFGAARGGFSAKIFAKQRR
jgi:hypothetical protein